eukprot:5901069-Prymnesium_polylepis.1
MQQPRFESRQRTRVVRGRRPVMRQGILEAVRLVAFVGWSHGIILLIEKLHGKLQSVERNVW